MKKLFGCLFVLLTLQLALQGCADEDKEKSIEERWLPNLGLRLQIDNYVLDDIYPNKDGQKLYPGWSNPYYRIVMDSIRDKAPNFGREETRYIGKIYNWDPECYDTIIFQEKAGGGEYTYGIFNFSVDSLGNFDFTDIKSKLKGLPFARYWVHLSGPSTLPKELRTLECYNNIDYSDYYAKVLIHFDYLRIGWQVGIYYGE